MNEDKYAALTTNTGAWGATGTTVSKHPWESAMLGAQISINTVRFGVREIENGYVVSWDSKEFLCADLTAVGERVMGCMAAAAMDRASTAAGQEARWQQADMDRLQQQQGMGYARALMQNALIRPESLAKLITS